MKTWAKIFIILFIATYLVVSLDRKLAGNKLKTQNQFYLAPTPTLSETKEERDRRLYQQINEGEVPECNFGRCPEYLDLTWCVFDSGPCASIVIVPTAMTKQAGEVWVIHVGKVVYKSPEFAGVNASIKKRDDEEILYISYISEFEGGIVPTMFETDRLIYKDGSFELVKISTSSADRN